MCFARVFLKIWRKLLCARRKNICSHAPGRIPSRTEATHAAVTNANLRQVLSHVSPLRCPVRLPVVTPWRLPVCVLCVSVGVRPSLSRLVLALLWCPLLPRTLYVLPTKTFGRALPPAGSALLFFA